MLLGGLGNTVTTGTTVPVQTNPVIPVQTIQAGNTGYSAGSAATGLSSALGAAATSRIVNQRNENLAVPQSGAAASQAQASSAAAASAAAAAASAASSAASSASAASAASVSQSGMASQPLASPRVIGRNNLVQKGGNDLNQISAAVNTISNIGPTVASVAPAPVLIGGKDMFDDKFGFLGLNTLSNGLNSFNTGNNLNLNTFSTSNNLLSNNLLDTGINTVNVGGGGGSFFPFFFKD